MKLSLRPEYTPICTRTSAYAECPFRSSFRRFTARSAAKCDYTATTFTQHAQVVYTLPQAVPIAVEGQVQLYSSQQTSTGTCGVVPTEFRATMKPTGYQVSPGGHFKATNLLTFFCKCQPHKQKSSAWNRWRPIPHHLRCYYNNRWVELRA